jgi:hypothetical protein
MPVAKGQRKPFSDNMGRRAEIANPPKALCAKLWCGSSAPLREQRIGGGTVGSSLAAMRPDPGDLGFEQGDPFIQVGLRIGAEVFAREAIRRVCAGAWAVWFFHCGAASAPSRLLSIGEAVIRGENVV